MRLADVFGISRDIPANYVPRPSVDGAFIESLTRDKHVAVFGSSKQGKTCLRKYNLTEDDHLVITCSNKWGLAEIHSAVLKAAGYEIKQSSTRTETGTNKLAAKLTGRLRVPGASLGSTLSGEKASEESDQVTSEPLELDPLDVNDVIAALQEADAPDFLVLEDFHYLGEDAQHDFAVSLKAFHENSKFSFIVVGVWLDENRLIELNGDLAGRVIAVDADAWAPEELRSVMDEGAKLLNVRFDPDFATALIDGCFESVSVVQDTCFRVCDEAGIVSTREAEASVGEEVDAASEIRGVVDEQSARYNAFLSRFASGFMHTELEMYRYLLYPMLTATPEQLETGVGLTEINRTLQRVHPRGEELNPGNVTQALKSAASLQLHHGIQPLILDYHQSARRLSVVDKGFLIWVTYQDRTDLLRQSGFSEADIERGAA
ncbi:hypothetical protein HJD18_10480 [Thermoleophilia bacterium SCSIO 60948]|nr:hypothetical protein HJD18_10480 [Thermoleophilia bacterium SCSIO 60948]